MGKERQTREKDVQRGKEREMEGDRKRERDRWVGEGGRETQPQNANNGSIEHGFQDTVVLEI